MQVNTSIASFGYSPVIRQENEIFDEPKIEKPKQETNEIKVGKTENLEKIKEVLAENNITLSFSQDIETKQLIVKLVDDKTGEAIRQIPSEISLKLAAIFVKMQGQFIDAKE